MKRMNGTKIISLAVASAWLACSVSIFSGCRSGESSGIDLGNTAAVEPRAADLSRQLFEQTNRLRVSKGMDALRWSNELAEVALCHAQTMAQKGRIGHVGLVGRSEQLRERGVVSRLTENVAYGMGHDAPVLVTVEGWNKSLEHRRNLLDERVTLTGVGCALTADGFFYFVQLYGR